MRMIALFIIFVSTSVMAKTYLLNVEGMDCPSCTSTIKESFKQDKSVKSVEVLFEKKQVKVDVENESDLNDMNKAKKLFSQKIAKSGFSMTGMQEL